MMWLMFACFSSGGSGDCFSIDDGVQREERLFQEAVLLEGDRGALADYMQRIEDPSSQDLLRLRLAVRNPAENQWLCDEVSTRSAQDRCRQVVGRPHLRQNKREDRP